MEPEDKLVWFFYGIISLNVCIEQMNRIQEAHVAVSGTTLELGFSYETNEFLDRFHLLIPRNEITSHSVHNIQNGTHRMFSTLQ